MASVCNPIRLMVDRFGLSLMFLPVFPSRAVNQMYLTPSAPVFAGEETVDPGRAPHSTAISNQERLDRCPSPMISYFLLLV